ncbi:MULTISPECIES: hypothetical protein [Amycolatopsis]|uniref:Uncharacterized protein n=1 Tax=Amycolatopsis japonica TaxID=208439 RepID=A0A075UUC6_9PSEU|nr:MULTISPECIES: hypothetical protein [Amycolatopsis]AIG76074.1 Hypothetical protein AJAP_16005 [Amycolatopsis japonica]OKK01478.1 hypothetical protein AMK34_08020 [Amycolatopsis sp. CB00013]
MTPADAREALLFHSCTHPDVDDPRWRTGFIGSLRPFSGLREENYHEVMSALRALAEPLQADFVPREVVSAVVGMCHFARAWGVAPDGMLGQNGLISAADAARLDEWIWTISYALAMILDGAVAEAFDDYDRRRT